MRDLVVFGAVCLTLPWVFRQPFIGLIVFSWLAYMRPQDLCWGFARSMRLSFFVGLTMIVGYFANDAGRRPFWRRDFRTVGMVMLLVLTWISTLPARVLDEWVISGLVEFTKIIIVALFTTGQVDSRQRLRLILWTIALCLGFFGFKGGLVGVLTGGAQIHRGPGGMMLDNNDFALALVMGLPMLYYLAASEKNVLLRKFTWVTVGLTAVTVVLTHSRGGFLAMVATGAVIAWRSRKLVQATLVVGILVFLFFQFAPQHVLERLGTIEEVTEGQADSSVNARFRAWTIALRMIGANPILGVGHKNFRHHYYDHSHGLFRPGEEVFNHVAHNSYLQIWAEGGTPAFVIFMAMLVSVFGATRWVRSLIRRNPDLEWARSYANMAEATTVGFMVGAFFLNRGHFDLSYHWIAIVSALLFVVRSEAARDPVAVPAAERSTRAPRLRWLPSPASRLPRWGRIP